MLQQMLAQIQSQTGSYLAGAILLALLGLAKSYVEARSFRDRLMRDIGELKAKDAEQQTTINGLVREMERQRGLKHACRDMLAPLANTIALYRKKNGRDPEDKLDLAPIYAWGREDPITPLTIARK